MTQAVSAKPAPFLLRPVADAVYFLRKTFYNRRFPNSSLSYNNRIIFSSSK